MTNLFRKTVTSLFRKTDFFSRTYGRPISYSHKSVKRSFEMLRMFLHVLCGHFSLQFLGDGTARCVRLRIGPGAGYVTGATLFVGVNVRNNINFHVRMPFTAGATRNANRVPMV